MFKHFFLSFFVLGSFLPLFSNPLPEEIGSITFAKPLKDYLDDQRHKGLLSPLTLLQKDFERFQQAQKFFVMDGNPNFFRIHSSEGKNLSLFLFETNHTWPFDALPAHTLSVIKQIAQNSGQFLQECEPHTFGQDERLEDILHVLSAPPNLSDRVTQERDAYIKSYVAINGVEPCEESKLSFEEKMKDLYQAGWSQRLAESTLRFFKENGLSSQKLDGLDPLAFFNSLNDLAFAFFRKQKVTRHMMSNGIEKDITFLFSRDAMRGSLDTIKLRAEESMLNERLILWEPNWSAFDSAVRWIIRLVNETFSFEGEGMPKSIRDVNLAWINPAYIRGDYQHNEDEAIQESKALKLRNDFWWEKHFWPEVQKRVSSHDPSPLLAAFGMNHNIGEHGILERFIQSGCQVFKLEQNGNWYPYKKRAHMGMY